MSYASLDPDSDRAVKMRKEKVAAFLDRHGFPDVNKPRDNGLYRSISVEPLHPLQVAEQYKDDAMVNMLKESGAKRPPGTAPRRASILTGLRTFASSHSSMSRGDSVVAAPPLTPMKSCLSDKSIKVGEESKPSEDPIVSIWV
eukprot:symbB.v1.2.025157.t1/scaffold2420.1/size79610/1